MALGWLLIPALGGYWFLTHCNWTRFNAARASGYHLFFQAAIAGAVLVVVAYIIVLLGFHVCPYGGALWKSFVPFPYSGTAVLSAMLGVASPLILNRFHGKGTATRKAARDKGDLIELLLAESTNGNYLSSFRYVPGSPTLDWRSIADSRPTANLTSLLSHWPVDIENLTVEN